MTKKLDFGNRSKAGKNIQDVLKETGVSVEVPSQDSGSDTIRLRGEQTQMGAALTLDRVLDKIHTLHISDALSSLSVNSFFWAKISDLNAP